MILSARSEANLVGVHPDLVRLWRETPLIPECSRAEVVEGVRTFEKQEYYVKTNKSETLNSRHLTGHAFDFSLYRDEDGDGDEDFIRAAFPYYEKQWKLFHQTGKRLGIAVEWGGYWGSQDGMHLQLSWKDYPIAPNPKTVENSKTIAASIVGIGVQAIPAAIEVGAEWTGKVSPFVKTEWVGIVLGVLTVCAFAFVINERRKHIQKDGT